MATEIPGFKLSGIAATQLVQYTFVAATTGASAMTVSAATSATSGGSPRVLGVVQNAPTTGAVAEIMVSGVSKVYASGDIKAGQGVTIDTGGKAKALTVDGRESAYGVALSTAAADQLVTVLLDSPDLKS